MVLQVFADESGTHPGAGALVLAGYLANTSQWAAFSDEWDAVKAMVPKVEDFKMSEFVKLADTTMRNQRLRMLNSVVKNHVQSFISVVVPHAAVKTVVDLFPTDVRVGMKKITPYKMAWISILRPTFLSKGEPIDFIFDEQVMEKTALLEAYEEIIDKAAPEVRKRMGVLPKFERDNDFPPLQAADMLAWLRRNDWEAANEGRERFEHPWPPTENIFGLETIYDEAQLRKIIEPNIAVLTEEYRQQNSR